MSKSYAKTIHLTILNREEVSKLEGIIFRLGYEREDYRIIEYGHYNLEMKILNRELHRDMRTIRKTTYNKEKKEN